MALLGIACLLYGEAVQTAILPEAQTSVPPPPALDHPRPAWLDNLPTPTAGAAANDSAGPASGATADAAAMLPPPGWATHLSIPSIDLETDVVPVSIATDARGQLEWPTVPFLAVHYVDTAPVGGPGNAVIAGHVVTLHEGNVFRDLYRVDYGDTVTVETDAASFTYVVSDLKLVLPSDVAVMEPTADPRLTLITCGGDFDQRTRTFDRRLVVTAELVSGTPKPAPAAPTPGTS